MNNQYTNNSNINSLNNMNQNDIILNPQSSNNQNEIPILNNEYTTLRSKSNNINNNLIMNSNYQVNVNDPFFESQQKALSEFKKVLNKVDENLQSKNQDYVKLNEEDE